MSFVVIRLGKDSVIDIKKIDSIKNGISGNYTFTFNCKQVEESILDDLENEKVYTFIYLGSDNNQGTETQWKKGLRALGILKSIKGRVNFQSTCELSIEIFSIFPESYSSRTFLEHSSKLYINFSSYPVIGLNNSRNNSIQKVHESERQQSSSLLKAISNLTPIFRADLSRDAPELLTMLDSEGDPEGYEKESEEISNSLGWGNEYPLNTVLVRTENRAVIDVVKRINKGRFRLDPDFQRDFLWSVEQQSKLIESCLMRIPLPVFYVAEARDGRVIVVDGLQRLTTFHRYLNGKFALKGIGFGDKSLSIEGKRFDDLPLKLQERIEDTPLTLYILDERAPERAKLDIFDRVNGGVPLTRQQMRNCLFNGPGTLFLKEASESSSFIKVTGRSLEPKKMRDREIINRFCAFYLIGFESYKGDMDDFLAKALEIMNEMSESDLEDLSKAFDNSMKINYLLFGEHSFRKSLSHRSKYADRSVINFSLFDVFSVLLATKRIEEVQLSKSKLLEEVYTLFSDYEFVDSITTGTNSSKNVYCRFIKAAEAIEDAIEC